MKLVTLEGLGNRLHGNQGLNGCPCGGRCKKCRGKRAGCCPQNSQPVNVNVITNTGWQDGHTEVVAPTTTSLTPTRNYISPDRSVERDVLVREQPKNITINMPKSPATATQPATAPRAQAVQQSLQPQMVQKIHHPTIEFY